MVEHSFPERAVLVQVRLDPPMKKKNTVENLEILLKQKRVIFGVYPNIDALLQFVKKAQKERKIVRLLYGETYDAYGITIDSLKYYLFLSNLHTLLEKLGLVVESTVVIADRASVLNKSVEDKETILYSAQERLDQIEKIIQIYHLKIQPLLMSVLFANPEVEKTIQKVRAYSQSNKTVQKLFEKTVLQNKIAQEKQTHFQYAAEAVATALQFDMKIGPPREQYYDKAAAIIGEALGLGMVYGIYLKPTYPLGKDFSFFITHPEIEEFGITPYKAGSNRLQDFRIILGTTSQERAENLIKTSFIPNNLALANPVGDMSFIADLAKNALGKTPFSFYPKNAVKDPTEFKNQACENLTRYVFTPLREGGFYA